MERPTDENVCIGGRIAVPSVVTVSVKDSSMPKRSAASNVVTKTVILWRRVRPGGSTVVGATAELMIEVVTRERTGKYIIRKSSVTRDKGERWGERETRGRRLVCVAIFIDKL